MIHISRFHNRFAPPQRPFVLNRDSPQSQGLIGWWPLFGPLAGNNRAYDLSGLNQTLAAKSPSMGWIGDARFGHRNVLAGDGSDDIFTDDIVPPFGNQLCIMFWFYLTALANDDAIVAITRASNNSDHFITMETRSTGALRARNKAFGASTTVDTTATVGTGEWHEGVGSFDDAADIKNVYLDGKNKVQSTTAFGYATSTTSLGLGGRWRSTGPRNEIAGAVAHVRIYDRMPTDDQVQAWNDPMNRFDLCYELGRRTTTFVSAAGPTLRRVHCDEFVTQVA